MKRLLWLLLALVLVLPGVAALAVPGIDEPSEAVQIVFEPFGSSEPPFFRAHVPNTFNPGDRQVYDCAFVEVTNAARTQVDAIVTFERTDVNQENGQQYVKINDRGMAEVSDGHPEGPGKLDTDGDLCGEPNTTTVNPKGQTVSVKGLAVFDNTDHFPHMIHEGDSLVFYRDTDAAGDGVDEEVGRIPLDADACSRWYFTPGDEPGEFWLWDDPDGPTGSHDHETNDLNCGGGPEEPSAIARVYVDAIRDGSRLQVCSETFHEVQCGPDPDPVPPEPSPSPSPSPSPTCVINPKTGECKVPKA